ncbi:MAG: ABC transporter substrate-binding protein [Deltaproteobacteria bacterium]
MKSWKTLFCSLFVAALFFWAAAAPAEEVVIGYSGPLSGPAAEYGQDCVNGVDMAVKELNAAGGITVKGKKYTFRLERLDDRVDPTQAVNNARRFVAQYKTPVVFNSIATTIGPLIRVNETKGSEFLVAGYSSVHAHHTLGNKLVINPCPNFLSYIAAKSDIAWRKGYRNGAMVVTLGAYGDAWRKYFRAAWEKKGGKIVGDFPANYYTETDFSAQLASAINTKADFLLIGGPSATTALVVEQARGMGFKGGMIVIDQARMDYIAHVLNNMKLMEGIIGIANIADLPLPASIGFAKKYKTAYKKAATWESALNYNTMHIVAKAMVVAGSVEDPYAIRAAVSKALPILGDKYPNELFSVEENGVMNAAGVIQSVENGKFSKVDYTFAFPKTKADFEKFRKMSKTRESENCRWLPVQ